MIGAGIIQHAKEAGLFTNVGVEVGLPGRDAGLDAL